MNRDHPHRHSPASAIQRKKEEGGFPLFFKHLGESLLLVLGIAALLILSASLLAYFAPDPNAVILPMGLSVVMITAFFIGYFFSKKEKQGALMTGLVSGSVLLALLLLCSLFMKQYAIGYATPISLLLHLSIPLLSIAGAYLGNRPQTKRRKRHK